jgi:GTP cyclohydrolase-4
MPIPADVQNRKIRHSFKLTKVGVKDVRKPVRIRRAGKSLTLTAAFDIFVDLPASQKGSHLSRNLEIVAEIVNESVKSPMPGLEFAAEKIAVELLNRHSYATQSEVWARAEYFLERTGPGGRKSLEPYELVAKAWAHRDRPMKVCKAIGVKVIGMTACPCAMETIRGDLEHEYGNIPEHLPTITHNQRNITSLMVDAPPGKDVEADELIDIVESSVSSPTFEILKRPEEGMLVRHAHENPRFVEDVVREVLAKVVGRFKALPGEVKVSVRSESEESIHKHNAFAERVTTLAELRRKPS